PFVRPALPPSGLLFHSSVVSVISAHRRRILCLAIPHHEWMARKKSSQEASALLTAWSYALLFGGTRGMSVLSVRLCPQRVTSFLT
ncbi:MAG: hypothetical protein MJZ89_05210, partial [Paludibacteraceae bacterium]|nr:hypothetical protein [Paludibacteraceae bacterium]